MTSYAISQNHNAQSVLWAIGGAIWTAATLIRALLLSLLPLLSLLAKALVIGAALASVIAAVAAIPVTFWLGLGITAAFGYLTFPRSKGKVRNG